MHDDARQHAAEQVRAHLVTLRGGAPFLSSADGQLLLRWLDEEVPVARICVALEHAAQARRKRPSRIPLSLSHAKRHLGKVMPIPRKQEPDTHPFTALATKLRQETGAARLRFAALADALLALPDDDALVDDGVEALRVLYEALWADLPKAVRQEALEDAIDRLGDMPAGLDESVVMAAAEEQARLHHLAQWPWLSANTLWELAG